MRAVTQLSTPQQLQPQVAPRRLDVRLAATPEANRRRSRAHNQRSAWIPDARERTTPPTRWPPAPDSTEARHLRRWFGPIRRPETLAPGLLPRARLPQAETSSVVEPTTTVGAANRPEAQLALRRDRGVLRASPPACACQARRGGCGSPKQDRGQQAANVSRTNHRRSVCRNRQFEGDRRRTASCPVTRVGRTGLEPVTPCASCKCSSQLS
jgi:hypothetical protein